MFALTFSSKIKENIFTFLLTKWERTAKFVYMSMTRKIRFLLVKKNNIPEVELARRLDTTPRNLNQKMECDNFIENDLREIVDVLGCDVEINFIDRETGEKT